MYKAIIARATNIRKHPNADRLQLATVVGCQVVVGLDVVEGQLGVYFATDGIILDPFAKNNNLYRKKDAEGKSIGGMFEEPARVRTQKFRKAVSDGFFCELGHLVRAGVSEKLVANLVEGYEFDELEGIPICKKWINQQTVRASKNSAKTGKKSLQSVMFKEHVDTAHLFRNLHKIERDQHIILTLKMHGTSARIGNVLVERNLSWSERWLKWAGVKVQDKEWCQLAGTRRVVLGREDAIADRKDSGYYSNEFRHRTAQPFVGNIRKGETWYYEVVGYENAAGPTPIMPIVNTQKIDDKDFTNRFANMGDGTHMVYKYGCEPGEFAIYVYRITVANEDGHFYDLSWNDVKARCHEVGVKHVPEIVQLFNVNGDQLEQIVRQHMDGPDLVDPSHWREGVVVRVESGISVQFFKAKNDCFKIMEGHAKESGAVDQEEAQDPQAEEVV